MKIEDYIDWKMLLGHAIEFWIKYGWITFIIYMLIKIIKYDTPNTIQDL